jgi:hypothetical protein
VHSRTGWVGDAMLLLLIFMLLPSASYDFLKVFALFTYFLLKIEIILVVKCSEHQYIVEKNKRVV